VCVLLGVIDRVSRNSCTRKQRRPPLTPSPRLTRRHPVAACVRPRHSLMHVCARAPDSPWYDVSRHGIDAMVQAFLGAVKEFAALSPAQQTANTLRCVRARARVLAGHAARRAARAALAHMRPSVPHAPARLLAAAPCAATSTHGVWPPTTCTTACSSPATCLLARPCRPSGACSSCTPTCSQPASCCLPRCWPACCCRSSGAW
jgi:hypothetical protein